MNLFPSYHASNTFSEKWLKEKLKEGCCLTRGTFLEHTFYTFCKKQREKNVISKKKHGIITNPLCEACKFGLELEKKGKMSSFPKNITIKTLEEMLGKSDTTSVSQSNTTQKKKSGRKSKQGHICKNCKEYFERLKAKGLCRRCYNREYSRRKREELKKKKQQITCYEMSIQSFLDRLKQTPFYDPKDDSIRLTPYLQDRLLEICKSCKKN